MSFTIGRHQTYSSKVLICAALYSAGGVETHVQQLCRVLLEQGAEVTVVARSAARDNALVRNRGGVRLLRSPLPSHPRWLRLSTAYSLLTLPLRLGRDFDVLYTVGPGWQEISRFTLFLSRFVRPGGQVIANPVGWGQGPALERRLAAVLTGLIAETPAQAEWFREKYRLGVPTAAVPTLGNVGHAPRRAPRKVDCLRIGFLGRLDFYKGIYRLLEMWSDLRIQPAQLTFFGPGPEAGRLQSEIIRRGLAGQVRLHGWYGPDEMPGIFDQLDLVVLPSAGEGMPLVLLEAMAHGVPFVASDVGAVRTLAQNNPDVRVVPLDNLALKAAIEEMAAEIRAGRVCGQRLQQYHRARYSQEALARRWADALLASPDSWPPLQACVAGNHEWRETEALADRATIAN